MDFTAPTPTNHRIMSFPTGLHFSPGLLSVAYVRDKRLTRLPDQDLAKHGPDHHWFRPAPGQLDYFAVQDLIGVKLANGDAEGVLTGSVTEALQPLGGQDPTPTPCVVAVPVGLAEFQRRRLVSLLASPSRTVRLLDSALAGLHALQGQMAGGDETLALIVAEDSALEIAVAKLGGGECKLLAQQHLTALSGRALNHFLLAALFHRLPERAQAALANDGDAGLSAVLTRLIKVRPTLGRIASFTFPVPLAGEGDHSVKLGAADIKAFFAERSALLTETLQTLIRQTGTVDRVIVVGDFGEFSDLTGQLERELAPVELAPITLLADGAALAAREPNVNPPPAPPEPVDLERFFRDNASPLHLSAAIRDSHDPAETMEKLFTQIATQIAGGKQAAVRELLQQVKQRSSSILAALETAEPADRTGSPLVRPALHIPKSRDIQRILDQAERMLEANKPLEAVALSHQALQLAEDNHEVLMALLDIHRRGAALLSGPANFENAVHQLQCALQHRQNDQATRNDLASRQVEQALYCEQQGRIAEAQDLLEEALKYADDDSLIIGHLTRLEGTRSP